MEFTCLTPDQINKIFDVNNNYSSQKKELPISCLTDFAIFLGAHTNHHKRAGSWIGKTLYEHLVPFVSIQGIYKQTDLNKINGMGIRVAIPISNIGNLNKQSGWSIIEKNKQNIIATYGELPQDKVAAGTDIEQELRKLHFGKCLPYTEKIYKFYFQNELLEFKEFSIFGDKYIVVDTEFRKTIKHSYNDTLLRDKTHPEKVNLPIFFKVKPIEWNINIENKVAYTTNLLVPTFTIKFLEKNSEEFEDTNLYNYLNNELKENLKVSNTKVDNYQESDLQIKELEEIDRIKSFLDCSIPVFLHGKSGDGKSARVKQIDPNAIILYMRNMSPEGLIGKSIVANKNEGLIDIPPTWYLKLKSICENDSDNIHILFFDELTNGLPSLQSMAFNIVLKKEVNGIWKLPENARIIAAGNEVNDSLAANELAEPLYGRFAHVEINTNVLNWTLWAFKNNIHPLIITFIKFKGMNALRTDFTGVKPNADPRKWEMASRVLYETNNPKLLRGLIGDDLVKEFIKFITLETYQLKDVIENSKELCTSMSLAEKYLTAYTMSFALEEDLVEVFHFMKQLDNDVYEFFKLLWKYNNKQYSETLDEISEKSKTLTK